MIILKVKILRDDTQMTRPAVNFTEKRNELNCVLALSVGRIAIHKFQMISNKLIE